MNSKFIILIIGIFFFLPYSSFCSSLEALLGKDKALELKGKKNLTKVNNKNKNPEMIPDNRFIKDLIEKSFQTVEPNLFVESLNLYPKSVQDTNKEWANQDKINLYNQLLKLSSLKGIEYFSKTKNKMRILYEESFVIEDSLKNDPIDDPYFLFPPEQLTLFVKQEDTTFGENIYKYQYYFHSDGLFFVQENVSSISYGIIPVVGKNKQKSIVAVFDTGDYLVVYLLSMAKASSIPGMGKRIKESFSNRTNALMEWFTMRADIAFDKIQKGDNNQ